MFRAGCVGLLALAILGIGANADDRNPVAGERQSGEGGRV